MGSVKFGSYLYDKIKVFKGVAIGLHYLMAKNNKEKADNFFAELAEGSMDKNIRMLRDRIYNNRTLTRTEVVSLIIKTWVAYRDGLTITCLKRYSPDLETFPKIDANETRFLVRPDVVKTINSRLEAILDSSSTDDHGVFCHNIDDSEYERIESTIKLIKKKTENNTLLPKDLTLYTNVLKKYDPDSIRILRESRI